MIYNNSICRYQLEKLWLLGPQFDDIFTATPTLEEIMENVSDEELFRLTDEDDSSEFVEKVEIVNPWDIEYKSPDNADPFNDDDDEDAYII